MRGTLVFFVRLVWLMVLEALFSKLRFRIICHMKCRVSWMKFYYFSNPIMFSFEKDLVCSPISEIMSENGEVLPGGARLTFDPTPPLVPTDAGPGHVVQDRHGPLDLALLDQVDEGVQRLAVAPLTPRSKRIQELEAMVTEQSARHHATVVETQEIIDRANGETRALQREKDGAGWRPQPPAPLASLPAMPVPFEFGGFSSNPPTPRPNLSFLSCSSSSSSYFSPCLGLVVRR